MGLMDRPYMREGSYPRYGTEEPETEEHIRSQAMLQASLSGFGITMQPTAEGFLPATKGDYAIDLACIGGQYRIWHKVPGGAKVVTSRPSVEEAIEWVEDRLAGKPIE